MTAAASEKQLQFIERLVSVRPESGVTDVKAFIQVLRDERLTKTGASALIDALLVMPEARPEGSGSLVRRGEPENRYAGTCVLCGGHVPPREGTYRRGARGWETLHLPGGCTETPATETPARVTWDDVSKAIADVPDGYYCVEDDDALAFFVVKTNRGFYDPSKKGRRYFRRYLGGDQEVSTSAAQALRYIEAAKAAGLAESQARFGREIGQCGRCGRSLTDEVSRRTGLGPECRKSQ